MQNYVQKGQTLTVVAPYALLSGGGCQVGNIFGVTVNSQNIGDSSELVVEGVFDLAKDTSTFNPGDKVFWNNTALQATSSPLTAAGVSNKEIGYAVLYLCARSGAFVTGASLVVDGGLTIASH